MKTPEVIKNSLRICSTWETNCEECPYKNMKKAISCSAEMNRDSLTYIEQLEKRASLNTLRDAIYEDAVAHGLWDDDEDYMPTDCVYFIKDEVCELDCAAMDLEDDVCNDNSAFCDELSDVIIMCLSVSGYLGIDIDAAVRRKMEINKGRPWKHGKDDQGNA